MFITIRASEGYILTDGENYAKIFSLAENKTASDYREITIEEYETIMAEMDAHEDDMMPENQIADDGNEDEEM
jgi:hypothetical protein